MNVKPTVKSEAYHTVAVHKEPFQPTISGPENSTSKNNRNKIRLLMLHFSTKILPSKRNQHLNSRCWNRQEKTL
jgi:hypothetical protein